ncbi:MAG TPA: hypothetical protein DCM05_06465 [Elusimicrobia bacterium]|nr:hypothetical protein [Elusimicrobiota bacterium]
MRALLLLLLSPAVSAQVPVTGVSPTDAAVSTVPAAVPSPPELRLIWPNEGQKYPALKRSFVFGSVTAGSTLTLNGQILPTRASGAFLAMVDFSTGPSALRFEAFKDGLSSAVVRSVAVGDSSDIPAEKQKLVVLEPREDLLLPPGDWLNVRARGPSEAEGSFRVANLAKNVPLFETEPGLYEGRLRLPMGAQGQELAVELHLRAKKEKLTAKAPGKLSVLEGGRYQVAVSTARTTILKTLPGGYDRFLPPGVPLAVSGRSGTSLRIALAPEQEAWVDASQVRLLPEGSPVPGAVVGKYLGTAVSTASVRLSVQVDKPVPFEVAESVDPLELEVRFFGAQQRIDRIRYAPGDPVVAEVRWRQESARIVKLTVRTRLRGGYGYDAFYEKGRFVLDIRRPPSFREGAGVLQGKRVVLDPGHGPDKGAVGPLGSLEQDVNLALALRLKSLLEGEGAEVFLTRTSSAGPALADRPALAWDARGDVLVSIHNNSLDVMDDPFEKPRGFMTLFYHPHSRALAEAMHAAYRRGVPLADEALIWGNLAVCRTTQMPAVLTESAYMLLPEQEELLLSPEGQGLFARTMLEGLREYFEACRRTQAESEDERRAAREP